MSNITYAIYTECWNSAMYYVVLWSDSFAVDNGVTECMYGCESSPIQTSALNSVKCYLDYWMLLVCCFTLLAQQCAEAH